MTARPFRAQPGLFDLPLFLAQVPQPAAVPIPAATPPVVYVEDPAAPFYIPPFLRGADTRLASQAKTARQSKPEGLTLRRSTTARRIDVQGNANADAVQAAIQAGAVTVAMIRAALPALDAGQIDAAIVKLKDRKRFAELRANAKAKLLTGDEG